MTPVSITVSADADRGPLRRIWRSFGYDEINWTYTPIGKDVFRQIRELNDGPYWIRNHNAFTSGNRLSSPYWASTNCYREGTDGRAVYDWDTIDRVYDVYVEHGCKPMIELDFMPHDLSSQRNLGPKESWRYPPRDHGRWRDLNFEFARHLIRRYGRDEVRTWYFSPWNEPDLSHYFVWRPDEDLSQPDQRVQRDQAFFRLYDYAADGICSADPELRFGGPELAFDPEFLDRFLSHCHDGTNHATGATGSRLDFISVHRKATSLRDGKVANPDFDLMARRAFLKYASIIRRFERFRDLPIVANEWDIDVGTPYGIYDSPDFAFRNNSYYPAFTVRTVKEALDLIDREGLDVELITQWTFYFQGMRCFEGTRALFDPMGIRKPLFNGFEMLARLGETRLAVSTDDRLTDLDGDEDRTCPSPQPDEEPMAAYPQVDALAARSGGNVQVIVWHQVRDQYATGVRPVSVTVTGLGRRPEAHLEHYRIDGDHANAHTVWQSLGCPDWPTDGQIRAMKARERLEVLQPPGTLNVSGGAVTVDFDLPVHGLSLLLLRQPD